MPVAQDIARKRRRAGTSGSSRTLRELSSTSKRGHMITPRAKYGNRITPRRIEKPWERWRG